MITFQNGVIDLSGWEDGMVYPELMAHDRKFKSLSCLDFDYSPGTQCPTWLAFLNSSFEGDQDRIRLLQQWMGYLLVFDYRWQKMMIMAGESRSGKGVITGVIQQIVGPDAYAGTSLTNLSGEFGLEPLQHAKVAVIGDAQQALRDRINTAKERLLNVTGGDSVPVNRKHKGEITCRIPARLMLLANDLPRFADGHDALTNRYIVLPFTVSFAGREDVNLPGRLKDELSGIFNWAVDGLLDLALCGKFVEPEVSMASREEIRMQQNPVAWFAKKFLSPCKDPDHYVPVDNLYSYYAAFCDEIDMRPLKKVRFATLLFRHAGYMEKSRPRINGTRTPCYKGAKIDLDALSEFTSDSDFL
jgi:putative DNA primase/helicase